MKKILIIGAGYGGLRALEHLAKSKLFEITIVDKNPYHYMQTEVYGYIAGHFDISSIAIDLESFTKGFGDRVKFVRDEAVSLDEKKKVLILKNSKLDYDYAIIAIGAVTNFFSFIKGAKEYTKGIKNIQRSFEFRQSFEKRLHMKLENKKSSSNDELHIAVAGAGLSGVEVAAEMAYTLKKYRKILSHDSIELKISLIDAADTILPGMDKFIIKKTEKRLLDLGIKIQINTFIKEIQKEKIIFNDDSSLDFDFIIYTAGIKAADFTQNIDTEKNSEDQIIPDKYLYLQGSDCVFVIGDCAEIRNISNKLLYPTAQIAEKSAEHVARSIINLETDKEVEVFDSDIKGIFVALGGKYAIGILYDKIKVEGYLAYVLKKILTRLYRFGLEVKVNVGYKQREQ